MRTITCTVDIDLPRDKVVELFDNVDNLYRWQEGLGSFEHVSGEPAGREVAAGLQDRQEGP